MARANREVAKSRRAWRVDRQRGRIHQRSSSAYIETRAASLRSRVESDAAAIGGGTRLRCGRIGAILWIYFLLASLIVGIAHGTGVSMDLGALCADCPIMLAIVAFSCQIEIARKSLPGDAG